ncbi:hypothetical protein IEQ34_006535 [Dendrobium chrysotoxum]|uniref:Uncharacterized protein n=1 Tax=Dendrobium chrysotoxum TaxID=161865 RepID=A0AAV7H6N1_DENCH|nr:hypothetical protein IEQ34_006535 [Dendrobium chrysotoxum]
MTPKSIFIPPLQSTCVPLKENGCTMAFTAACSFSFFATQPCVSESLPQCSMGASFIYLMCHMASSQTKEAFWRAYACANCRDYKPMPEVTHFYSHWDIDGESLLIICFARLALARLALSKVYNKWERQDSKLCRKPSTDL